LASSNDVLLKVIVPGTGFAGYSLCRSAISRQLSADETRCVMPFELYSSAFEQDEPIPYQYTCDGPDRSPPLEWSDVPSTTRSFVLIVEDMDAPNGTFTHWVLYDIFADMRSLDAGQTGMGLAGLNDFQAQEYRGPCPPPRRGDHRYVFTLYALDVATLDVGQPASRAEIEEAMTGHILGQASLGGRYARR
jgi:hypothetical protein